MSSGSSSYPYEVNSDGRVDMHTSERDNSTSPKGLLITGLDVELERLETAVQSSFHGDELRALPGSAISQQPDRPGSGTSSLTFVPAGDGSRNYPTAEPTSERIEIWSPPSPEIEIGKRPESVSLAKPRFRGPDLDSLLDVSASTGLRERQKLSKHPSYHSSRASIDSGSLSKYRGHLKSPSSFSERFSPLLGMNKSPKLGPEEIIQQRADYTARWGIHFYLPSSMVLILALGIIAAIGHHVFYSSLNGKPSENQLIMIRYGTALAFFVKASLVGSVDIAYRQRIWYTMRKKAMSLKAIDAMFGVIDNPALFVNVEMIRKARTASFLAAIAWLIPLASVISPSALTSEIRRLPIDGYPCVNVSSLDFQKEVIYDYKIPGLGHSIAFYNDTVTGNGTYYDEPSFYANTLATRAVTGHGPVAPAHSPCTGFNCTYHLSFDGPAYKCVDAMADPVLKARAPFNTSIVVPDGQYTYFADVDKGDYKRPNTPPSDKDFDPHWTQGTFFFEPELWLAYSTYIGTPLPNNSPYKIQNRWNNTIEPHVTNCRLYHAKYTVEVTWDSETQSITINNLTYVKPVMMTMPEDKHPGPAMFVRPGASDYQITAVYHALGSIARNYLRGSIHYNTSNPVAPGHIAITYTDMITTKLMAPLQDYPPANFREQVENLFQDILFSMWSDPSFEVAVHENVTCQRYYLESVFIYHQKGLWVGYSVAICAALLSCIIGGLALHENGIASDTLFSRIMVTTRNPTIDRLSRGACLGSDPFPRDLALTEFRFGVLDEGDGQGGRDGKPEHCAFGTVAETTEIVKGRLYAGLRYSNIDKKSLWGKGEPHRRELYNGNKALLLNADSESQTAWDSDCDEFHDCEEEPLLSRGYKSI